MSYRRGMGSQRLYRGARKENVNFKDVKLIPKIHSSLEVQEDGDSGASLSSLSGGVFSLR